MAFHLYVFGNEFVNLFFERMLYHTDRIGVAFHLCVPYNDPEVMIW